MSRENQTLNLIRTAFPGRDQLIEKAFNDTRSFRDLCEDYRKCFAALHRWKRRTTAEASRRHQEYTDLLMELGREIGTWLEDAETESPPTNRRTA
jgi:hypothetical protein